MDNAGGGTWPPPVLPGNQAGETGMDYSKLHEQVSTSSRGKFWLDLNPMTKLVMALCGSALAICTPGCIYGFALTLLLFLFALTCGKGKAYGKIMLSVLLIFVGLLVLARALFHGSGPVLATFGGFSIYRDGILAGLNSSSIILGFSSSLVFFYSTTEPEHLMLTLEKHRCSPYATFTILSTFQMIPQMGANARVIQDAQRARGIETEGGIRTRAKAFIPMLMMTGPWCAPLWQLAFRELSLPDWAMAASLTESCRKSPKRHRPAFASFAPLAFLTAQYSTV